MCSSPALSGAQIDMAPEELARSLGPEYVASYVTFMREHAECPDPEMAICDVSPMAEA
jgi:hypothetical protein